jgi:hypothetical protein
MDRRHAVMDRRRERRTSMNGTLDIHATSGRTPRPECVLCGEPIGVYEPLVTIERGRARTTSRAAEPALSTTAGEYRHLACHERHAQPRPRAAKEARESSLAG